MNHRFICLSAAVLALAACAWAAPSGSRERHATREVEILVNGVPQPHYVHRGRWYVEAHKGREYAIRLRNPHGVRVAVALSVDGLNSIDARETTAVDARKWVLGPYETVTIVGWQTSQTQARRFEFTTEAGSYGQALGKTANLGVISAAFFRERPAAVHRESNEYAGRMAPAPQSPAPAEHEASAAGGDMKARDEYAATGMGRRTGHVVTQVWMDLEDEPVHAVSIRYEFRPQLVRLGILPQALTIDPLQRRERAHGFEPGFSPEPSRNR